MQALVPRFEFSIGSNPPFTLGHSAGENQRRAARLLLRLLVSVRADHVKDDGFHTGGAVVQRADVRLFHNSDVFIDTVGDGTETVTAKLARAVRLALRTMLEKAGRRDIFPGDSAIEYDQLVLDGLDVSLDLVEFALNAEAALEAVSDGTGELFEVIAFEDKLRGVIDFKALRVAYDHLMPFDDVLLKLHIDLLRAIISFVNRSGAAPEALRAVRRVGPLLASHGHEAFDRHSAQLYLVATSDDQSELERRIDLLTGLGGEAAEVAAAHRRRLDGGAGPADHALQIAAGARDVRITAPLAERPRSDTAFGPEALRTPVTTFGAVAPRLLRPHAPADGDARYVRRSLHDALEARVWQALSQPGLTLIAVKGDPLVGKTHLVWEVLRDVCPEVPVIAPASAEHAAVVCDPAQHPALVGHDGPVLLWLDDVEDLLAIDGAGGLTAAHLAALPRHTGAPPIVALCTFGGWSRERLRPSGGESLRQLLELAPDAPLELRAELDGEERSAAAGVLDAATLADVDRAGLGPTLGGRPALRFRFSTGFTGPHMPQVGDPDEGRALVDALLYWRAAVGPGALSDEYSQAIWACVRGRRGRLDEPSAEAWQQAKAWATTGPAPWMSLVRWEPVTGGWLVDSSVDEARPTARLSEAHELFGTVIDRWAGGDAARREQVESARDAAARADQRWEDRR